MLPKTCCCSFLLAAREPSIDVLYSSSNGGHDLKRQGQRAAAILQRLAGGDDTIPAMVAAIYVGLDPRLRAAARSRAQRVVARTRATAASRRIFR